LSPPYGRCPLRFFCLEAVICRLQIPASSASWAHNHLK
jgi:hypothetical protein